MRELFCNQSWFVLFKCTNFLILDLVHPFATSGFVPWWNICEVPSLIFHQTLMLSCHGLFPFKSPFCLFKQPWFIDFLNIGHQSKVDCVWSLFSLSSWWSSLDHFTYLNISNVVVPPLGSLLGILIIFTCIGVIWMLIRAIYIRNY